MPAANQRTALIGLDWGTSSFRAYRMDIGGRIIDHVASGAGILSVSDGDFAAVLRREIGDWLVDANAPPILACGMIGSRQGWHEIPYVELPADIGLLAQNLASKEAAEGPPVRFVAGLTGRDTEGVPDVMRGEETQLLGALDADAGRQLFILPGTHSKWANANGGRIEGFATFMTGEVFAVLSRHSILGRLMSGDAHDPGAFGRGLDRALSDRGAGPGLLHRLFGARSLPLSGDLPETGVASYLSGLLIGSEIAEALRTPDFQDIDGPPTIIGRDDLADLYADGLAAIGIAAYRADPDTCATGLHRIADAAGLLRGETA